MLQTRHAAERGTGHLSSLCRKSRSSVHARTSHAIERSHRELCVGELLRSKRQTPMACGNGQADDLPEEEDHHAHCHSDGRCIVRSPGGGNAAASVGRCSNQGCRGRGQVGVERQSRLVPVVSIDGPDRRSVPEEPTGRRRSGPRAHRNPFVCRSGSLRPASPDHAAFVEALGSIRRAFTARSCIVPAVDVPPGGRSPGRACTLACHFSARACRLFRRCWITVAASK